MGGQLVTVDVELDIDFICMGHRVDLPPFFQPLVWHLLFDPSDSPRDRNSDRVIPHLCGLSCSRSQHRVADLNRESGCFQTEITILLAVGPNTHQMGSRVEPSSLEKGVGEILSVFLWPRL